MLRKDSFKYRKKFLVFEMRTREKNCKSKRGFFKMIYHPKKTHWIKRCVCGKPLATWNKSGLCSACHKDIYKKKPKEIEK